MKHSGFGTHKHSNSSYHKPGKDVMHVPVRGNHRDGDLINTPQKVYEVGMRRMLAQQKITHKARPR